MPLDDWMPTLKEKMGEVEGMVQAHDYSDLPAALGAWPVAIILPVSGRMYYSAGGPNTAHHEVQVTVYVASQIIPEAYSVAVPFIELVRNKLADSMTLDAKVAHCLPSSEAPFYDGPGGVRYAKNMHLGIIFRLQVKENEGGTYPVSA